MAQSILGSAKMVAFAATTSPARARRFYRDTLGLKLVDDSPFALVFDANGTMLRVQRVEQVTPPQYTVAGWHVKDIDATVRALKKKRVRCQIYSGMGQDELGIWASPSGARIAWFTDPDGNILSLTQS
jgi:catechol 2,3-dioxygenase-like lactoylglutathione lyase family enzyme